MQNKILIFRRQNMPADEEMNEAILDANKEGWRVISAETAVTPFGQRKDRDFEYMPLHIFYVTTVLLQID